MLWSDIKAYPDIKNHCSQFFSVQTNIPSNYQSNPNFGSQGNEEPSNILRYDYPYYAAERQINYPVERQPIYAVERQSSFLVRQQPQTIFNERQINYPSPSMQQPMLSNPGNNSIKFS